MKTRLKNTRLLSTIIVLGVLFWSGCEDSKTIKPEVVSISPSNGATNVARTTAIEVTFSKAMDTLSCESRFGLHTGELTEMPMMGMMGMGTTLGDVPGQYSWNDDHTVMTFQLASALMDSALYSICLMEGMESEDHEGMITMDGMMDHGSQLDGGMVTMFSTE